MANPFTTAGAVINGQFGNFTANMGVWQMTTPTLYGGFVSIYATNIINREGQFRVSMRATIKSTESMWICRTAGLATALNFGSLPHGRICPEYS